MNPREIENHYLRWGASPRRAGQSVGRYGQGGKAAIGHLGNRFEILASRAGDDRAHPFSDPQYRDRTRLRTYELHIGPSRWPWTWATCTFRSARSIGNPTPCGSG